MTTKGGIKKEQRINATNQIDGRTIKEGKGGYKINGQGIFKRVCRHFYTRAILEN
jgi:hypothetical protein